MLFFFFSSRRRHTRYWRDWSSDVCSSDLELRDRPGDDEHVRLRKRIGGVRLHLERLRLGCQPRGPRQGQIREDRKSGGEGKSVDLGGRRIIKKKKETKRTTE